MTEPRKPCDILLEKFMVKREYKNEKRNEIKLHRIEPRSDFRNIQFIMV
jgi:hypothetical protein